MSAAVGIFTRAFGVGSGTLFPLPTREEGSYGIGKGRAAGHRVQLADWAYLIEAAEQRAPWANSLGSVKHDIYRTTASIGRMTRRAWRRATPRTRARIRPSPHGRPWRR